jgi:hypothetical protein
MSCLERRVISIVAVVVALSCVGAVSQSQKTTALKDCIPKAMPRAYRDIRDGRDWANPVLTVVPFGVILEGKSSHGQIVSVDSVPGLLE